MTNDKEGIPARTNEEKQQLNTNKRGEAATKTDLVGESNERSNKRGMA